MPLLNAPVELCDAIREARTIGLVGHVTPDADCLGSIASLWLALPELGCHPCAFIPEGTVSRRLSFLLRSAGLAPAPAHELDGCDLMIVVDTAKERRVNLEGRWEAMLAKPIVNIDHHSTNTQFGKWNWVNSHAASSCELVYELLRALGCQITPTIATLLYAGLHTDTQGFSLASTTTQTLAVARDLSHAGARISEVCERLHRSQSKHEFDLLKVIFANTRVTPDGRLAWSTASHSEIIAAGCSAGDIENQVEIPRSIEGISAAILLTEGHPGKVRINFRGEGTVPILHLAQQFGGGGHIHSAGAMLDGELRAIEERVISAATRFLAKLPREPL